MQGDDRHRWIGEADPREALLQALFTQGVEGTASDRMDAMGRAAEQGLDARLQSLLYAHDQLAGAPEISRVDLIDPSSRIGSRVGGFTVGSLLASGGTADVYLGTQDSPARQVVLKIRRARSGTSGQLRRFLAEAERVSVFSHAGIAHVYGSGVEQLEGGAIAWIAMERIDGTPLSEWRVGSRTGWRERCRMLAALAHVIADAHAAGLVHRDLAPRNILVARDGTPRILDFGIARTLHSLDETVLIEGTPGFASPEQQAGAAASVADDSYSIGRLIEWLAPDAPRGVRRVAELCVGPAESRPSAVEIQRSLERALRSGPKARRVAIGLALFMVGGAFATWGTLRVVEGDRQRELTIARSDGTESAAVTKILDALLESASVASGGRADSTMLEAIARAETEIDAQADASPAVRSMALERIATLWRDFGDYPRASATAWNAARATDDDGGASPLKSARLRAFSAMQHAFAGDLVKARAAIEASNTELQSKSARVSDGAVRATSDDDTAIQADYAQAYVYLALGAKLNSDFGLAREFTEIARPFHETGVYANSDSAVTYFINAARLELSAGDLDLALQFADKAVAISEVAEGVDESARISTKMLRAGVLEQLGRFEEAAPAYQASLDAWTRVGGELHPHTITAMNNLGLNALRQGKTDRAIELLEETCRRALITHGPAHPHTIADRGNLGLAYKAAGRLDDASAIFEDLLTVVRQSIGSPSIDECDLLLALGQLRLEQNLPVEARRFLEETLAQARGVEGATWHVRAAQKDLAKLDQQPEPAAPEPPNKD
ncbi:MAG: serine/threonine-protein kinase [Planctomycetota bacterium]|nr:serine/threonine-protein kinase [Planctomycetota bacterium]